MDKLNNEIVLIQFKGLIAKVLIRHNDGAITYYSAPIAQCREYIRGNI